MSTTLLALLFASVSQTFNLPDGALSALCFVESGHNPAAVHFDDGRDNSLGACQVQPTTARILGFKGTDQELMEPANNVYYAGKYLHKQLIRYNMDTSKAIAAYNTGTYKVSKRGGPVNKKYVNKVIAAWREQK